MTVDYCDKRSEVRFPVQVGTTIQLQGNGRIVRGVTVDMSSSGVLLCCEAPGELAPGDQVNCDFTLVQEQSQPLPYWGIGEVLRVNGTYVAIGLNAIGLCPAPAAEPPGEP